MSLTPKEQLNKLPASEIRKRLDACIWYYANKFQRNYTDIHIDPRLLRHAIEIALLDLLEYAQFHNIPIADEHKQGAFLMYWIARIKPIQIESNANFTPALGVVNEVYGIFIGLNHLNLDVDALPDGYLRHLIYALHRGHTDCSSLAREMFLLQNCVCWKPKKI